jgi:hypothetical protein
LTKKLIEVEEGDFYILVRPKADDEDGDWSHETTITCNKSAKIPNDVYDHYFNLARAMVGLSYIANDGLIDIHNLYFDRALEGKITGKEGEMLWNILNIDFELEEPVVERRDNVIKVDFTKKDS